MSNQAQDFSIRPLFKKDAKAILKLKRKSIQVLNSQDYSFQQIQALIGEEETELNSNEINI